MTAGHGWACYPNRKSCGYRRRHHCLNRSCDCGRSCDSVLDPSRHCQGTRRRKGWHVGVLLECRMPAGQAKRVMAELEFLQDQVTPDLVEGWERHAAHDVGTKVIVSLVQPQRMLRMKLRSKTA
jgi:hypothetical protein